MHSVLGVFVKIIITICVLVAECTKFALSIAGTACVIRLDLLASRWRHSCFAIHSTFTVDVGLATLVELFANAFALHAFVGVTIQIDQAVPAWI